MSKLLEQINTAPRVTRKLGEVIGYIADNRGKNPSNYVENGIPVIDNFMITGNRKVDLILSKRFIDEKTYRDFIRKEINEDDILVTLVGNGYGQITLAPKEKAVIIQNTIGLRANHLSLNNYLFYLLSKNKEKITALDRGAAQPSIKVGDLLGIGFDLPDLPTQQKIAGILSVYDSKIENNNFIIKKLENITETIFNEWFLNFRFPGHEKTRFAESEHGIIPEGWSIQRISSVADLNKGVSYSSKEINSENEGVALINLGNFRRGGGFNPDGTKNYTGEYKQSHSVKPGQIMIAMTDLTSNREVIGHPARLPENFKKAVISLDVCSLVPRKEIYNEFLYYLMLDRSFSKLMASCASGTNVSHLSKSHIEGYDFVFPSDELLIQFNKLVQPMVTQQAILGEENFALKQSRDRLLAKLI